VYVLHHILSHLCPRSTLLCSPSRFSNSESSSQKVSCCKVLVCTAHSGKRLNQIYNTFTWTSPVFMCKKKAEYNPSIHFLYPLNPSVGSRGGWSLSQRSSGERRGTPWTGRQSITVKQKCTQFYWGVWDRLCQTTGWFKHSGSCLSPVFTAFWKRIVWRGEDLARAQPHRHSADLVRSWATEHQLCDLMQ